jgi:hypothetical protein
MKRIFMHIIVIWASCLILHPQPGEAEMKALTEKQMGDSYFKTWNFSITADRKPESSRGTGENTEEDVLLEETAEDRLDDFQQDRTASGLTEDSRIDPGPRVESSTTKYGRWETTTDGGGHQYTSRPSAPLQAPWSQPLGLGSVNSNRPESGSWQVPEDGLGQQEHTSRPGAGSLNLIPRQ